MPRRSGSEMNDTKIRKTRSEADLPSSEGRVLLAARLDLQWTDRELETFAELASRKPSRPTEALIRALRKS